MRLSVTSRAIGAPYCQLFFWACEQPGEFLADHPSSKTSESDFVKDLRKLVNDVKPIPSSNHYTNKKPIVQKSLCKSSHVFVRNNALRTPLQQPYKSPYEVVKRFDKYFIMMIQDRLSKIPIDRLKAVYISYDDVHRPTTTTENLLNNHPVVSLLQPTTTRKREKPCSITNPVASPQSKS